MNILNNHTGTKICEKCLDHAITTYIFINKTQYIRNRLNICITNMLDSLRNVNTDNKIFIEIADNGIIPLTETYDENLLLNDDEIDKLDENKLKVDVLEDEYRTKDDEESSGDENDVKKTENKIDDSKKALEANMSDSSKMVNGFKFNSFIDEFLTFKKKGKVRKPKCRYSCPICSKNFISDYFLVEHVLRHVPRKCKCKVCCKVFNSKFRLREHVKMAHLMKLATFSFCQMCGRGFKNEKMRIQHEKSHIFRRCDLCAKQFVVQKYFNSHMQRHRLKLLTLRRKNSQTCSFCEKECSNDNQLSIHVNKVHLQIKPYNCDMCERQFYTERNLRCHKKVHSMPSVQKCEFCSKMLKSRRNLVVHVRKHIGIKPFQCSLCTETFYCESKGKQHMKKWHGGSLICKLCKKVFVNRRGLKDHVNGAHSIF